MRTHVWLAALVVVLGFALRSDAQVAISAQTGASSVSSGSTFFHSLSLTSFLKGPSNLGTFFPSMPSIGSPNGVVATSQIPLNSNGQAGDAYFKLFNLQAAPRAH